MAATFCSRTPWVRYIATHTTTGTECNRSAERPRSVKTGTAGNGDGDDGDGVWAVVMVVVVVTARFSSCRTFRFFFCVVMLLWEWVVCWFDLRLDGGHVLVVVVSTDEGTSDSNGGRFGCRVLSIRPVVMVDSWLD